MFELLRKELSNKPFLIDKKKIIANLKVLLEKAVSTKGKIAIAFSGGIDSIMIAYFASKLKLDFVLYSVGLANSQDLIYAREISSLYKWPIKIKVLSLEEAELIIIKVFKILKNPDPVHIGIGAVVYAVLEMAKKDKIKTVLGGLGAEEIFAGYQRHSSYGTDFSNINNRLWEGLAGLESRDLSRDLPIARHFGIELKAPYLDENLVKYSMQISPELKMNQTQKKIILRELALSLGISEKFALRKKLAAQYGSKFDYALLKLAKKENLQLRKDYLKKL